MRERVSIKYSCRPLQKQLWTRNPCSPTTKCKRHLPKKEGLGVGREEGRDGARKGGSQGQSSRLSWPNGKSEEGLCQLLGKLNWRGLVGRHRQREAGCD